MAKRIAEAAAPRLFGVAAERSRPIERNRDALADADAHGRQRAVGVGELEAQRRRAGNARAGHAERMAERDRAAVRR